MVTVEGSQVGCLPEDLNQLLNMMMNNFSVAFECPDESEDDSTPILRSDGGYVQVCERKRGGCLASNKNNSVNRSWRQLSGPTVGRH